MGGGAVVGGGVAAVVGGVGAGVGFAGGLGGLSAVVGVGVPPVGTVSRPGGGSTSCCASSTAAWTASRVPPVRPIDPLAASTRTCSTTRPPAALTWVSLVVTVATGAPSSAASATATWAATTACSRALRALGSWLNIRRLTRLSTSSRRFPATRVRSSASRAGDHCTEAMRTCSMASLNGYMAWPGRAAAEAMVAGARTRAAARATATTRRRTSQPPASWRTGSWTTVPEPSRTRSRWRSATPGSSS